MSAMGLGGGASDLRTAVGVVASQQVRSIRFRSQVSPTVQIDPRQRGPRTSVQASQAGGGEFLLRLIRPTMDLDTSFGPIQIAPWGTPQGNYFWPLTLAAGLGVAVAAGLVLKGARS